MTRIISNIFVSLVIFWGGLEIGARAFLPAPQSISVFALSNKESYTDLSVSPDDPKGNLYVYTQKGLRLHPRMRALIRNHRLGGQDIEILTNSLGIRNRELGEKKSPRILFLGDSITFADYLDERFTYVRLTESIMREQGIAVETVNAGVGAHSAPDYAAFFKEIIRSIQPNVVVVGLYLNDFLPSRTYQMRPSSPWLQGSWGIAYLYESYDRLGNLIRIKKQQKAHRNGFFFHQWRSQARSNFFAYEPFHSFEMDFLSLIEERIDDWGGAWSDNAWILIEKSLEDIAKQTQVSNIRLALTLFPVSSQVSTMYPLNYPQRKTEEISKRLGAKYIDVLSEFRKYKEKDLFFDHCHHTREASKLTAEVMADNLKVLVNEMSENQSPLQEYQ